MEYSMKVHRGRDAALDKAWKEEHQVGKCGGVKGSCYICCKKKLFISIRKILSNRGWNE